MNFSATDHKIIYIDSQKGLEQMIEGLSTKKEFSFDTEFDRFYREYGFKLSLLQVFDGEICFLVDPLSKINLQPLWVLFEDDAVCKIVYSCSEDIQILKINGCNPRNIYDLQIAGKLCNHPSNSLGDLILKEFGIEADKSLQRSNWRRRPLSREQLKYAGTDVSMLIELKHLFEGIAAKRGVTDMITEENKKCETIAVAEYSVKLSVNQKKKYDSPHQKIMLDLLMLRNDIAIEYNVPPANIVSDATLENIIENKKYFLSDPFAKGFSRRIAEDENNKIRFMNLIAGISDDLKLKPLPPPVNRETAREPREQNTDPVFEKKYNALHSHITDAYGKEAGEFILRGFKKSIIARIPQANKMRSYQQNIIVQACKELGIDFGK